ncbi:hypothetical protein D3C71_1697840 [compost metagenome]
MKECEHSSIREPQIALCTGRGARPEKPSQLLCQDLAPAAVRLQPSPDPECAAPGRACHEVFTNSHGQADVEQGVMSVFEFDQVGRQVWRHAERLAVDRVFGALIVQTLYIA